MKINRHFGTVALLCTVFLLASCYQQEAAPMAAETAVKNTSSDTTVDPLPSWNEGAAKQSIIDFVNATTTKNSVDFVPVPERIAVFDNDGNLWAEQPMYFQAFFVLDQIKKMAPQHPEWQDKEPFASVLKGDMKSALAGGEHSVAALLAAAH